MYDDFLEKIDARINELTVELGKTEMGTPKYRAISEDLERLYKMKSDYETREQNRLNSNARNELEEVKVQIEEKELEVRKQAQTNSLIQAGLYGIVTIGCTVYSYMANKTGMADRTFKDTAQKFGDMMRNLIRR